MPRKAWEGEAINSRCRAGGGGFRRATNSAVEWWRIGRTDQRPGTAISKRIGTTVAVAGDDGNARCSSLEIDDPEALAGARHDEGVSHAEIIGKVAVGHVAQKPDRVRYT